MIAILSQVDQKQRHDAKERIFQKLIQSTINFAIRRIIFQTKISSEQEFALNYHKQFLQQPRRVRLAQYSEIDYLV